jgi:hypothetical protein
MRGFYRVPLAAWIDAEDAVAFPDVVECDRTTRSVYCLSATAPRADLEAAGAVFLGSRLSEISDPAQRERFIRYQVRRVETDAEGNVLVRDLLVRADEVAADDEVLGTVPAALFAGDRIEDVA